MCGTRSCTAAEGSTALGFPRASWRNVCPHFPFMDSRIVWAVEVTCMHGNVRTCALGYARAHMHARVTVCRNACYQNMCTHANMRTHERVYTIPTLPQDHRNHLHHRKENDVQAIQINRQHEQAEHHQNFENTVKLHPTHDELSTRIL